jgi:UDP-N-acetylglucosamine 2-epimerase
MLDRKLLTVVGARPQFVKAAVLSRLLSRHHRTPAGLSEVLVHTGQHYDPGLSSVFFTELEMPRPDYYLGVGSGPHGQQTGRMVERLETVMVQERPSCVLVYGDTNSTLAGSLAASKLGLPIAHVEAGLRSYNRAMPEEINRVIADHLAALLFCPTSQAVKNLSCEGLVKGVHLVGDIMYDSLLHHLNRAQQTSDILSRLGAAAGGYGLATVHRAETTADRQKLERLFQAFGRLEVPIIVPLHPRTQAVLDSAALPPAVWVIEPVSYYDMLILERHARLILTDSGGVQKEAYWLRVPCITLRAETEWVETVDSGWNRLAGTDPDAIVEAAASLQESPPPPTGQPYGNGQAGQAILDILTRYITEVQP